jgi:hypothetical protein
MLCAVMADGRTIGCESLLPSVLALQTILVLCTYVQVNKHIHSLHISKLMFPL